MSDETRKRATLLAKDDNLDLEDVRFALGVASAEEAAQAAAEMLDAHLYALEPAARRYLEAVAEAKEGKAPNRLLLDRAPAGAQKDMYYPRTDVVALQEALTRLGAPTDVDGAYGPKTAAAVQKIQTSLGLRATGALDADTLVCMNEELARLGQAPLDLTPRNRVRPDWVIATKANARKEDVEALQAGLMRLGQHFGKEAFQVRVTGTFDRPTEAAVRAFQADAFLPETGFLDLSTLDALNAALSATSLEPVKVQPTPAPAGERFELHFYPGDQELRVYVMRAGEVLDSYGMVGGKNESRPDPNNASVGYDPTPAGRYEIMAVSPHTASAWAYSFVPYGSELREVEGEIQFRDGSGVWRFATGEKGIFAGRNPGPLDKTAYLDENGDVMTTWRLNDFGHIRGLLRTTSNGRIQSHMIHSTPSNEATSGYFQDTESLTDPKEALSILRHSHGCEHIHPKDLDEMISKGYFAPGTVFVVHGYDETMSTPEPEVMPDGQIALSGDPTHRAPA